MTETQKKLLELTEEIAKICDENGIVYYLAGGSTIGVLRHRGFIPWDDDMDIMMTRDNWVKFLAATRDSMPPGRELMCQENSRDYNNMFGRYVDTTSTTIHRGDILGGGAAGFVIDILCLDPIPDEKAYHKYIEDLMLYSDLINPMLNYSTRWMVNENRYEEYLERIRKEGRDAVLRELEAAMFSYDEDSCDYLVLRWGGVPFLFDKKMYGESRWGEFEGRSFRIMDRASDYLVQHYGDEWAYIPPHDEQLTHDAIFSPEIGYESIMTDYLSAIDVTAEKDFFFNEKKNFFRNMKAAAEELNASRELLARIAAQALEIKLKKSGADVMQLLTEKKYEEILQLFAEYIGEQGSRDLIGREDFPGIDRFNTPTLIDIREDYFYAVIVSMINSNRMSKAMRFLDVWEFNQGTLSQRLEDQRAFVLEIRRAISEYDVGNVLWALDETERLYKEHPDNKSLNMLLVTILARLERYEELKAVLDECVKKYPDDGYIMKYLGDYYRYDGRTELAHRTYEEALRKTNNGMTMLEIGELAETDEQFKR